MKVDIKGKKALVTGASRGIGKAITQSLLEAGAIVIATAKDHQRLEALENDFKSFKSQLSVISADLGQRKDVQRLCESIDQKLEGLDIIVNNAGVFYFELLSDTTDEMLTESFSVNAFAPFMICRYFVPRMIKRQWGRIINICSSSAYTGGGTPKHCVYSASKHALLGFSRALDDELRKYNIRVGTVSPAGVATDMMDGRDDLDPESFMKSADVAESAMYLITSDGPGITYEMRIWRMHR